jgi:hypothetical protein
MQRHLFCAIMFSYWYSMPRDLVQAVDSRQVVDLTEEVTSGRFPGSVFLAFTYDTPGLMGRTAIPAPHRVSQSTLLTVITGWHDGRLIGDQLSLLQSAGQPCTKTEAVRTIANSWHSVCIALPASVSGKTGAVSQDASGVGDRSQSYDPVRGHASHEGSANQSCES